MKTLSSKITAISDPMQVAGEIQVLTGEYNQIYNPSAQVYEPNRMINPTKLAASITGVDPNSASTLEVESAEWYVDGTRINSGNEKYVLRSKDVNKSDNIYLDIYANGDTNGGAMSVECIMSYINKTTGIKETVRAERVLTTTVHDTYHLALAATTETEAVMNPMKDGDKRVQDFGCKLMAGQMQVPADYYWYVRTMNNGTPSDVKVTGTESWFKGAKHYEYTTDTNGEIIADSWELNDGGEIGTWATITVDVAKTDKLMLVCKAVPTYVGVDPQNKLQNNYQQVFRASMELPVLKKVKMHAIQGYTTKHNADVTATHFKAYVDIFVGSQELNGNDENERATIDEFFSVIWYKRINNKSTIIGYGATLDVTYQTLGITTTNVNGIDAINEATIPEIYAEVSENYISGGVQGAVYSNYETPNPKAVFGNDSIADELAAYLVETTYNEDGTTTVDAKRLMKNNWFRYENGQPAPTLLCTQAQYETAKASTEYNNNGEQTYLGVPVACYNPTGIDKNLDILYGWSEPVWTVELHTIRSTGEMPVKWGKAPFEVNEDGQVLEAVKIPPTLICPGLPTVHNGKFRTMFFLDGCGYGSDGNAGAGNIITTFNDTSKAWVATGISNNSNNTYSFAKNKDTNNDNTPYAPLMHWHYNNILCALETKFKSAILHDESMFGAGISSNVPFTVGETSGVYTEDSDGNWIRASFSATEDLHDASGKKHNWSEWLSNQGSRMVCLEQQMFFSWAAENIKLEYKNNKGDGRCRWRVVDNKVIREENPYRTFSSACARVFAGETIYVSGAAAGGSVYPYILADADMNFISGGTFNANIATNITIEQDGWLLVNRNEISEKPAVVCIKRTTPPYEKQILCKIIKKSHQTYKIFQSPKTIWDGEMSGKINVLHNIRAKMFYDADGNNNIERYVNAYCQMSCVHGIDLVSADVFQCQNGIENILTVEKEGNVDGNPRTIWICKDQTKLYRGTESTIASGEKYPFETDGTYELLGESKTTQGWGNNFLRGTCIPTEDGGSLSKISGYYYTTNYGNTTPGNRNRMGFRGRGSAHTSYASARYVFAFSGVSHAAVSYAGGFQIRLPEKDVSETT